jgi:hypothetical protein
MLRHTSLHLSCMGVKDNHTMLGYLGSHIGTE